MTPLSSTFAFTLAGIAVLVGRRRRVATTTAEVIEEWEEPVWQEVPVVEGDEPSPREWLFWSFFLCMAIVALPLIGIRWTTPEATLTVHALKDALFLALPVVVPLPFLFVGCVGTLLFDAEARTPAAWASFGAAMAIGLAALHALVA